MRLQTIKLDDNWSVRPASLECEGEAGCRRVRRARKGWLRARVPGEVHLDLARAGLMPDPLVSDNITKCRWPEGKSWWYHRSFTVPPRFLLHERQQLVFDGLDLYAQVFLNGSLVGSAANAFVPAVFDIRKLLKTGINDLLVRLTAGSEIAETREPAPPPADPDELYANRNYPPRRWLRKPAFAYGWDWIEPLPNIGIHRGVRLEGRSQAVLHELRLDTVRRDERVYLDTEAIVENLHPWSERAGILEIRIDRPGPGKPILRRYERDMPVGRSAIRDLIEVTDPQLWWPNGMGEQPLYHVTARVQVGRTQCDKREFDIGLRTVEVDRSRLSGGGRFCVRVNGEDVFCKGGNWGPADAILVRAGQTKYERLVAEARDAHFNMFRVNGVGTYEDQPFYDACDRAGILVWQDFTFSCSTYPDDDPEFRNVVREEAEAIVTSLRHHPCLALWCGSNENVWGFADWWNNDQTEPLQPGGTILYNQILPDVCRKQDPHRLYWPCSPAGGERPNDELAGDCHWWLPAFMNPDAARRLSHGIYDECRARFVSEFGAIGPCHIESIQQYLKPDERQLDHRAAKLHTNSFEKGTTANGICYHYAEPEGLSLAEFVLYGQLFQAQLLGRAVEAFRFRKDDPEYECQGALVWSYSDCWGETGWSIIDYYCRRKAAYYWYRRACTPVKVIVRRRGRSLVTRVVNDTRERRTASVDYGWFRTDGTELRLESRKITVPANGMVEVCAEPIPPKRELDPRHWVYGAALRSEEGDDDQCIWPLLPHRELAVVRPEFQTTRTSSGREISSRVYCHGVHFNDHGRAVLSDNYFDLLPGVAKVVTRVDGKRKLPRLRAICG